MQMSFFDFDEFAELKEEAKKREAPKKKTEKSKGKSTSKTVYKLPLTLKSIAGDLVMTEGSGTEDEVKKFLEKQGPFFTLCDVSKKDDMYLCRPKNHEGVEKGTVSVDEMQVFFATEEVDITELVGEVDLTSLFEYALKKKELDGLKLTLFKTGSSVVLLPSEASAVKEVFEDKEQISVLKAGGEERVIKIDPEAETLEEQLKDLAGYGTIYDLYPCGEKYYLGPKYAGVSSSTVKVIKYAIEGVKLSLMFTSYDLTPEDFSGKKSVTEEDLLNFLDAKGHLEYRLAGAVFTWLGKDKHILHVGTKGSKKGADDRVVLDKMQLPLGRQKVMYQGEIYDILNHPCFYCGDSLESGEKLFIWKQGKVDVSYWLSMAKFLCMNCDSEVALHLFYDERNGAFKWYVPIQEVHHASVEAERDYFLECQEASGLIKVGEFHSHGSFPAFFSSTDNEDEKIPGLYGVTSCRDGKLLYRISLGADKMFELTGEQAASAFLDSGENRLSWVLGWFQQVFNKSNSAGGYYIVEVGKERARAIYVSSYEIARFFDGILHVYSMDHGIRDNYNPDDHHFLISAEKLNWQEGEPMMKDGMYSNQVAALF